MTEIDPSTIHEVTSLLEDMRSYNSETRKAAHQCLSEEIARNELIEVLRRLLDFEDTDLRCQAAETLAKFDPDCAGRHVLPYLESDDPTFRWLICGILSTYGDKDAVMPLVNVLRNDPEADVRIAAAFALGRIGDSRAVPSLQRAHQDDHGTDYEGRLVSDVATEALQEIRARNRD